MERNKNGKKPDQIRIIIDVYKKQDKRLECVELECYADSDDDESQLEELD